ncbi:hypothetical protein [Paenibacillus sp. RC67]|uniref:hypothetical protein n=1 Tax=Paenibacillus sp. RC67 TaxID=3039392 RepID=UPI0024AE57CD|nr:hypothetical protein [Paenibacillus sp. RC67]
MFELTTNSTVFEAFEQRLAKPLHMEDFLPELHTQLVKQEHISIHGARHYRLSARDLARFGLLYLQNGSFGNQQLIPKNWIQESTAPYSIMEELSAGYGYLWWKPMKGIWNQLGMYEARGVGGQCISVIPQENLVFVHRADTDSGRHINGKQVLRLYRLILEAKSETTSTQAPPDLIPLDVEAGEMHFLLSHFRSFHHRAKALDKIREEYWHKPQSSTSVRSPLDLLATMIHRDTKALHILTPLDTQPETAVEIEQANLPPATLSPQQLVRRFLEQREQLYSILESLPPLDWEKTYSWNESEISVKAYFLTHILLDYQQSEPLIQFFNTYKDTVAPAG